MASWPRELGGRRDLGRGRGERPRGAPGTVTKRYRCAPRETKRSSEVVTLCRRGCLSSALPVAVPHGTIIPLARVLQPLMAGAAQANFSMVGSIPIFFMGVNLIRERTFNTADMLPAVLSRC